MIHKKNSPPLAPVISTTWKNNQPKKFQKIVKLLRKKNVLHTLPSNASLFFLNRIWDINLCTINGIVIGIHIEPTIHQNIFQLELLKLFATGFILILEFQPIDFISSELISVQCTIKTSLRMNDKSQHRSLVFSFYYFSLVSLLSKTRRMCVFMWVEKTMRKHNQLLLIVEGDNSNASTVRMCATTQTRLLWS